MNASYSRIEPYLQDQLPCWRVQGPRGELLIAQQGAQILQYREQGEPPLLWLSPQAKLQEGISARGGVPICWPWFGALQRNPQAVQAMHDGSHSAPAHGLVRGLDWQLSHTAETDEKVCLHFTAPSGALPGWPLTPELSLEIELGERLSIHLRNHNPHAQPLSISQALHSYFAVSDIRQVQVQGLEGCQYIETLEDWQLRVQQGAVRFNGETDRIYLGTPAQMSIVDPLWRRRVQLAVSGSASAVVWNPWREKANRLSQFPEDAWQQMLCIETANVWDDSLSLPSNSSHCLSLSLWQEPL